MTYHKCTSSRYQKIDVNTPNIKGVLEESHYAFIEDRPIYPQCRSECYLYHSSCLIVMFCPIAFCFSKYLLVLSLHAGLHVPWLTADSNTFFDDSCRREWRLIEFEDSNLPRSAQPVS